MKVTVRLYAQLRDRLPDRPRQVEVELSDGATVYDVAAKLGFDDVPCEIMVNDAGAHDGTKVSDGDVVSCFPPLAGG